MKNKKGGESQWKMETNVNQNQQKCSRPFKIATILLHNVTISLHTTLLLLRVIAIVIVIFTYLLWRGLRMWLGVGGSRRTQVWREVVGVEHVAQPRKVVKVGHCKEEPKEELEGFVAGAEPPSSPLSEDNTSQTKFNH